MADSRSPIGPDEASPFSGRIGSLRLNLEGPSNDDPVTVRVYEDRAALEKDFSSWDGGPDLNKAVFMGGSGLEKKVQAINGNSITIFYGTHAIDGLDVAPYPEVDAVVAGPMYHYMIQFHGMGTDPDSPEIQNYLKSFRPL